MEFKKIMLEDCSKYGEYYNKCMIVCAEISFFSVWSASLVYNTEQAFEKDFFWHKSTWNGRPVWLPPVGDWDNANWEEVLSELVPAGTTFAFVPEYLLKKWQAFSDRIEVTETRGDWDYIYAIERQVEGSGKNYSSWRRWINKFEKSYSYTFNKIEEKDIDDIRVFQNEWMKENEDKSKMTEELINDNEIFKKVLDYWSKLSNLIGAVLRVDGKVAAYIIVETIDDNIVSGQFLKANTSYQGAVQFIKYKLFQEYLTDYSILNAWGDSDLKGLRDNKISENPIVLYKKYEVVWKG